MIDIYLIIGFAGAAVLVLSYILFLKNRLKKDYVLYHLLNFIGSCGIIISSFITKSWPVMILFILLLIASVYFIFKILKVKPSYKELN